MKIIKKGMLPAERVYRETCAACGTVFEFTEKEAKVCHDQRDGSYLYIDCPLCSATRYLTATRVMKWPIPQRFDL